MHELVELLRGWTRLLVADGVALLPAEGFDRGVVRIREKAPLRRFRDVVARAAAEAGGVLATAKPSPLATFHTLEGEHAGLVTLAARLPTGEPMELAIAMVAGDDSATVIEARAAGETNVAAFRRIVRLVAEHSFLGLGEIRRRRYAYRVPRGWMGLRRAHATRWYHPRFPGVAGIISVFDARPVGLTAPEAADRLLFMDNVASIQRDPPEPPQRFQTHGGMVGQLTRITGTTGGVHVTVVQAGLVDERFTYLVHLETNSDVVDECMPAFVEVIDTVEPVPPARAAASGSSLIHWTE